MRREVLGHNCELKERGKCGLQLATRGQNSPFKVQQLSGGLEFGRDDHLLWVQQRGGRIVAHLPYDN
jgi:hypothetical protein